MGFHNIELVLAHSVSSGTARAVLLVLAYRANDKTGSCFPSISLLAKDAGLSRRCIKNAIKKLERMGELVRKTRMGTIATRGGMQKSNLYQLTLKGGAPNSPPTASRVVHEKHEGGAANAPKVVHEKHKGGEPRAPITRKEQKNEQEFKYTQKPPSLIHVLNIASDLGIDPDAAEEFFYHYDSQGWRRGSGQEISNIGSALKFWVKQSTNFANPQSARERRPRATIS